MKAPHKLLTLLLLLSVQIGCTTSKTGIDALWQQEVRARALDCYNAHSEQRYVIGSGPTLGCLPALGDGETQANDQRATGLVSQLAG